MHAEVRGVMNETVISTSFVAWTSVRYEPHFPHTRLWKLSIPIKASQISNEPGLCCISLISFAIVVSNNHIHNRAGCHGQRKRRLLNGLPMCQLKSGTMYTSNTSTRCACPESNLRLGKVSAITQQSERHPSICFLSRGVSRQRQSPSSGG